MAKMLRNNLKTGLCDCLDCGNGNYRGRAAEEREWRKEISDEDLIAIAEYRLANDNGNRTSLEDATRELTGDSVIGRGQVERAPDSVSAIVPTYDRPRRQRPSG